MLLTNPYTKGDHLTFRRTFLRQTEVRADFTHSLSTAEFQRRVIPFLESTFKKPCEEAPPKEANHVEVNSDTKQERFVFDVSGASFSIGPKTYRTFAETAIPMSQTLVGFLSNVMEVKTVDRLSIIKINEWPISSEDTFANFSDMIGYTFQKKHVSDLMNYRFDKKDPQPTRLSKTATTEIKGGTTLKAELSAEVKSKEKALMALTLTVCSEGVSTEEIIPNLIVMNDILYSGFMDTVSEDVIDLMRRAEL